MNEAMDKLREAVGRVDSDLANGCNPWRPLVVELVNTAKAVLASPLVVLTEAERATVEAFRRDIDVWSASGDVAILAIIDRIAPKPVPAHKPCPFCGEQGELSANGDYSFHVWCSNCGVSLRRLPERCRTEAEAWAAWDRRAEVKG